MRGKTRWVMAWLAALLGTVVLPAHADGNLETRFLNKGTVGNTRHNMTQRQTAGGGPSGSFMDSTRNDYAEVCVYCHTPHGANQGVALPLWNRTIKATSYTTYAALGTSSITQPITQPGPNSLACLSCHDGQVAVDSVINMPGSGGYRKEQAGEQSNTFLNTWTNTRGPDATLHIGLNPVTADGCLACHSPGTSVAQAGATDFSMFVIGTDLRNDHPVGVRYPTIGPGVDFQPTSGARTGMAWFDTDSDQRPDVNEVRLYDSGDGPQVECASCHDPHGVPSGGAGSTFNPTFLRVTNAGSQLCFTCHIK